MFQTGCNLVLLVNFYLVFIYCLLVSREVLHGFAPVTSEFVGKEFLHWWMVCDMPF